MKQNKQVFLLIGIALLLLTSCTDKSKLIVKTWVVSDLKYTSDVPKEMLPTINKTVTELKKSFRLSYFPDGTYITVMNDQELKGTWKMNWNSSKITSTANTGVSKVYKIIELNENNFSFEADEGGEKVIFIMVPAK